MLKIFFLFSFLILNQSGISAQQDSIAIQYDNAKLHIQKISEEDLRKYQNDPKFTYESTEANPTWWDDFITWVSNLFRELFEWIFGVEDAVGILAAFLKILPYILLVLLLYVLTRFFLNVNASESNKTHQNNAYVGLSDEEHIIKNEDIKSLIQKAIAEKEYRLAIRYSYLYSLQLMSEKEIIDWQLQKTNHEYLAEIETSSLKKSFSKITRIYDYIWYGDFTIDENKYKKAEGVFLQLEKMLKNA